MRTERLNLGNETSVYMFDHLFFFHSSFVSPSSPSEGLRNHVYFERKEHLNSPSLRGDFCWRKLKGEVLQIKILSSDLRDIFFHSTVVY